VRTARANHLSEVDNNNKQNIRRTKVVEKPSHLKEMARRVFKGGMEGGTAFGLMA
jgi:hypothetical protein